MFLVGNYCCVIHDLFSGNVSSFVSKPLKSGLLGQPSLVLCPGSKCILVCGGTSETFGVFCDGFLPLESCSLSKCLLKRDGSAGSEKGFDENPNYLGCDADCKRWFHTFCLGLDYKKYIELSQREYWQCNRFDCKSLKGRK